MKTNQKVVDSLNKLLACELTAIDVYFIHSRLYEDWGLNKLYERIDHEKDDEGLHADKLIRRILFLEGKPNIKTRLDYEVGDNVRDLLQFELDLEYKNMDLLKESIRVCESECDFASRDILLELLKDTEEDHIKWMEIQLELIDKIGIERYQQSMM
ncbi:bacterioferritin [Halobacteriovorax sp. GB3]|uniref:bacterioferritin n=1 Tax=Halobacteriovorax sp. GB3 TaxID=2719615 RepID=UPI002362FF3E|nr:bacterioferritin [Halobacteriovorax sp. GB3]MDD0852787.1 bacterioferritin [Halobacteriovorax sp. GB3]